MNSGGLLRTGFTFTHWNTSADGTGTNYAMESLYTSNAPVTLYANWLKDASLCSAENAFIDCHLEMLQEK
jgi:uncharacterized repeat protein (TIGR02543 family)